MEGKMSEVEKSDLFDSKVAVDYYNDRYADGYMADFWSDEHKLRIAEIICDLELPDAGLMLDFGCGNGQLTDVLRQSLPPGWDVYGSDLSSAALAMARQRFPLCTFLSAGDTALSDGRFDLLFSNHVLEHVQDLNQTIELMDVSLKPNACMLHVLPCGNPGSLEREISLIIKEGIDPSHGDRFFFEDPSHLRRMTTQQVEVLCDRVGFKLDRALYENHHDGSIEWITRDGPGFVSRVLDLEQAVNIDARRRLSRLRRRMYPISLARYYGKRASQASDGDRSAKARAIRLLRRPLRMVGEWVDRYWIGKAQKEWERRRTDPGGSAMFLYFKRV